MDIASYLQAKFPVGLEYETAAQLCLSIYSVRGLLPFELDAASGSMTGISNAFAQLAQNGVIKDATLDKAMKYGAEHHPVESSDHWNEIIACIFKKGAQPNLDAVQKLLE
jgi:hypothetical protein